MQPMFEKGVLDFDAANEASLNGVCRKRQARAAQCAALFCSMIEF
jgi:hypothetical protein